MRPPDHLATERLRLRPPVEADAPFIASYAGDPEVVRFLGFPRHTHPDDARAFVARCAAVRAEGSSFPWLLVRRADSVPLGMIELRLDSHRASVGYVLARAHWGQGFMPEAVGVVRDWARAQPGLHRFWAVCDVENRASARVLEKAGLQREGVLRRWLVHPNVGPEPRDCLCYALGW